MEVLGRGWGIDRIGKWTGSGVVIVDVRRGGVGGRYGGRG